MPLSMGPRMLPIVELPMRYPVAFDFIVGHPLGRVVSWAAAGDVVRITHAQAHVARMEESRDT
jgi:hypothetical protein